jgi:glyoxylate reductase
MACLFKMEKDMNVLVTVRLPEDVVSLIEREHQVRMNHEDRPMERRTVLEGVAGTEGLLCSIRDRVDEELLTSAPELKVIANYGVGYDHIDIDAASRRGIPVTNTPGVLTDATADTAFALILAVSRRVAEGDRMTREGRFKFWAPFHFLGRQVSQKTLGIIGMGRIGKAVARRAAGFSMRIVYHNRNRLDSKEEQRLGVRYLLLDELLREADILSLHVPLTPQTRHLIGTRELRLMKPSAFLINTARGPVVDEAALVEALRDGEIAGAGLDVYENEPELAAGLAGLENVVLLPHVGSATVETRTKMALMAVANLLVGLRGEQPPNCLNWSSVTGAKQE